MASVNADVVDGGQCNPGSRDSIITHSHGDSIHKLPCVINDPDADRPADLAVLVLGPEIQGDMMTPQLLSLRPAIRRDAPVSNQPAKKPSGVALACTHTINHQDRAPDSQVVSADAAYHDVWFIRSGILRLQRHAYDGRRQILSLFLPGEIVGFEGGLRAGVSVETATASGLCRLNRRIFTRMVDQDADLRAALTRQKQDQRDRLHWLTWSLGALSAEERLCALLALSGRLMPHEPSLLMRLPRQDIADLLGTTVESINLILQKLTDSGVIQTTAPALIRVRDWERLIEIGRIGGHLDKMAADGAKPFDIAGLIGSLAGQSACSRCAQSGRLTQI